MPTAPIPPDSEGFRQLFHSLAPAVHRFLVRLTRDAHAAEDLLQETFTTLWRKRAQFRGDGSVEGYLRQIAYRTWLNARVRLKRARAVAPLDVEPSATVETAADGVARDLDRRDALAAVRRAVDALPRGVAGAVRAVPLRRVDLRGDRGGDGPVPEGRRAPPRPCDEGGRVARRPASAQRLGGEVAVTARLTLHGPRPRPRRSFPTPRDP